MDQRKIHIALDLDRTLATFERGQDLEVIGKPIIPMIRQVRNWWEKGYSITIFTARVSKYFKSGEERSEEFINLQKKLIWTFCIDNGLPMFNITADKSPCFTHFVDDKAVKVIPNKGIVITTDKYL
jgi:hypothetical protein